MSKPTIIPNWKYQKPTKAGHRGTRKLLKYVSYRENAEHLAVTIEDRWNDCGLGGNWREVYANAHDLAGPYVLVHHLVVSPNPELMALVPDALKLAVLQETTERMIEGWHEGRGHNTPEYSYVVHDRDTTDGRGMQHLHTHVFVAGTIENSAGERQSHRVDRQHVCTDRGGLEREDNLHHVARREFEAVLDRTIGREWRQQFDLEQGVERDHTTLEPSYDISF